MVICYFSFFLFFNHLSLLFIYSSLQPISSLLVYKNYSLIKNYLLICFILTLKLYLVYPLISFITADGVMFLPTFCYCHSCSFERISEFLTFPIHTTDILI